MLKYLLPVFLFIACNCYAQSVITGRVIDKTDKKPVAQATVFLNNTVVATSTNKEGVFILNNVRQGQYTLFVTFVGYKPYKTIIQIPDNVKVPLIELTIDVSQLQEVVITSKKKFRLSPYYPVFVHEFLGQTKFARQCKILNPKVLHFTFDDDTKILSVHSTQFLEIENDALGYNIKYLVNTFEKTQETLFYQGPSFFEEMKGTPEKEQQWRINRMQTYLPSVIHFLRSILANNMEQEGFKANKLYRELNPYYDGKHSQNKYIHHFIDTPLTETDIVKRTDVQGLFALSTNSKALMYVQYQTV